MSQGCSRRRWLQAGAVACASPLAALPAASWLPDTCGLCKKKVPFVKPGSRTETKAARS